MMLCHKKFSPIVRTVFISTAIVATLGCSGVIAEEDAKLKSKAKADVGSVYAEFRNIIDEKADDQRMESFFRNHFDTAVISKRFCGKDDANLVSAVAKYLIWRLKSEALQQVPGYNLMENKAVVLKDSSVSVQCKLEHSEQKSNVVELTIVYVRNGTDLGKVKEIIIIGLPLIEGLSAIMKKYFEENKISINSIKNADERAAKCVLAINDHLKSEQSISKEEATKTGNANAANGGSAAFGN
jgi:hypothetical protein